MKELGFGRREEDVEMKELSVGRRRRPTPAPVTCPPVACPSVVECPSAPCPTHLPATPPYLHLVRQQMSPHFQAIQYSSSPPGSRLKLIRLFNSMCIGYHSYWVISFIIFSSKKLTCPPMVTCPPTPECPSAPSPTQLPTTPLSPPGKIANVTSFPGHSVLLPLNCDCLQ